MPSARLVIIPSAPRHSSCSQAPAYARPFSRKARRHASQAGSSLIEFSIVAIPILLLGLGSIEIAHWLLTRQVVSLALLEAGRAGILTHARPENIATAFEQALLPLFPATDGRSARQNQLLAFEQRKRDTAGTAWQITILSPSLAAFNDFSDPRLSQSPYAGLPTINNNYQLEQDQRRRAQGWANGLGPQSNTSIYQANTLTLRLSYLHKPALPGIKGLMRLLGKPHGTYSQHAMAHGYLPLSREISLAMQSHPVRWPMADDGHVVRPRTTADTHPAAFVLESCTGLWCIHQRPVDGFLRPNPAGNMPGTGTAPRNENSGIPPALPAQEPSNSTATSELAVTPDDPACGLTLCCAPA